MMDNADVLVVASPLVILGIPQCVDRATIAVCQVRSLFAKPARSGAETSRGFWLSATRTLDCSVPPKFRVAHQSAATQLSLDNRWWQDFNQPAAT
jgi:hypothetical protein